MTRHPYGGLWIQLKLSILHDYLRKTAENRDRFNFADTHRQHLPWTAYKMRVQVHRNAAVTADDVLLAHLGCSPILDREDIVNFSLGRESWAVILMCRICLPHRRLRERHTLIVPRGLWQSFHAWFMNRFRKKYR